MSEKRFEALRAAISEGLGVEEWFTVYDLIDFFEALNSHGYAIVPIKPNKRMLRAGADEMPRSQDNIRYRLACNTYTAMLKAAEEE